MTPLKTLILSLLILGVFCQCIAALFASQPKECCYEYRKGKPLRVSQIKDYYWTPCNCGLEAVVFVMKNGRHLCNDPRDSKVKLTISFLDKRK